MPLVTSSPYFVNPLGAYETEVLSLSPAGYWRLNDPSGTTAVDSSGNNNDGSYINTPLLDTNSIISNGSGRATQFNGSNEYVRINSSAGGDIDLTSAGTIALWARLYTTSDDMLMMRWNSPVSREIQMYVQSGTLYWRTPDFGVSVTVGVSTNTNYFFVGTFNGSIWRLFRNGSQVDSQLSSITAQSNSEPWLLAVDADGSNGTGLGNWASCKLQEVAIFDYALSPTQVSNLWSAAQ